MHFMAEGPDVIDRIFNDLGFSEWKEEKTKTYPKGLGECGRSVFVAAAELVIAAIPGRPNTGAFSLHQKHPEQQRN